MRKQNIEPGSGSNAHPCCIVLVDDDAGHIRLVQKQLLRCGIGNEVSVFRSGAEALEFFAVRNPTEQSVIVLLDLNMPGMSGQQVLKALRADERTKRMPVIVLTTSSDPEEIRECYSLGCSKFMTKPIRFDELAESLQRLGFMLQIVERQPMVGD